MICQYFKRCGGCATQHIPYEVQLENKRKRVESLLKFPVSTIIPSSPFHYRNRMEFIFFNGGIGLRRMKQGSIDIEECPIADEMINVLLDEVRNEFKCVDAFNPSTKKGMYRYLVIRSTPTDSSISFVLNSDSAHRGLAMEKIKAFQTTATNVIVTFVPSENDDCYSSDFTVIKGEDMLHETILTKKIQFSVQGFFQNNSSLQEQMHQYVRSLLESSSQKNAHLLDLYAGVGTFGIINADLFSAVTILERDEGCIKAATINVRQNKIKNAVIFSKDAKHLPILKKPLFVITDPPRTGMVPKTIDLLNKSSPELIIYISCNIEQGTKDIKKFKQYSLKSVAVFDFFPQTNHCEVVMELVMKNFQKS